MILQANPGAAYIAHKAEIELAIARVLATGLYIQGQERASFEEEFASYIGVRYAIGVSSGTDALHLALKSCGIGPGDTVITVSNTAVATVAAVELAGAIPLLVDIDPNSYTIDAGHLDGTIQKVLENSGIRIKAIIPVHLYGHPADMQAIIEIASRHQLYVIEDCAQSHGAAIQKRKTGTWGDMAAFSFYPTKNLGAIGDGGALLTNNSRLAEKARLLQEFGWRERYISEIPGMNTRLDELQAAILRVKLKYLDQENSRRCQLADIYNEKLADTSLVLPQVKENVTHVYHQYVLRAQRRDDLRQSLESKAVMTSIHYPLPVHLQPAYRNRIVHSPYGLEHSEKACREILSLPIYPQLDDQQVHYVSDLIAKVSSKSI